MGIYFNFFFLEIQIQNFLQPIVRPFHKYVFSFGMIEKEIIIRALIYDNLKIHLSIGTRTHLCITYLQYFQYQKRKLLWDESWIFPYDKIHEGRI